jgi:Transposase DDE domain group 1
MPCILPDRKPCGTKPRTVHIAFNLTRAAATLTRQPRLAKATTATIRRTLINVPARVASSARRITLHLPAAWPWQQPWTELFSQCCGPPAAATT